MRKKFKIDKLFVLLLVVLIGSGALIFTSAAVGLVARGQAGMQSVFINHLVLGVGLGLLLLIVLSYVDYKIWKKYAWHIFFFGLFLTALVFVPHIGAMHGGGRRWILLGSLSLQPSETLKFAAVVFAAAYYTDYRSKIQSYWHGLGGYLAIIGPPALLLLLQPDLGTLSIIVAGVGMVFFMAGARLRDIASVIIVGLVSLALLATFRPYVRDRVMTFFNPENGQHAESYQIRQSLIAIGSGELVGRGLGQGVQKFTYLPEPMGDSIFAVAGEELGFVGSSLIIIAFLLFAIRGFYIAAHAPDLFGALLAAGLSTTLSVGAFVNIGAMLGVLPLTGIPLTFVSQGGTAILVALSSAGVLLNISKHSK